MPLLRINNLIINTDQMIKAEYFPLEKGRRETSLIVYFTNDGQSAQKQGNFKLFSGNDADLLWRALTSVTG